MQQNQLFASHFSMSEKHNSTEVSEPSTADQEVHSKAYQSVTMLGLAISLGTTGILLPFQQQEVLAAVDLIPINRSLPAQITPALSNFSSALLPQLNNFGDSNSLTAATIPVLTLPQLTPAPLALNQLKQQQKQLSSDSGQLQAEYQGNQLIASSSTIEQPETPPLKTQSSALESNSQLVSSTPQLNINNSNQKSSNYPSTISNIQLTPKKTIVIRSNLEPNSNDNIPQLPSLTETPTSTPKNTPKQLYTVKAGDTLAKIARSYGISSQQLIQANQLQNPDLLLINQQLTIPTLEAKSTYPPSNTASVDAPKPLSSLESNSNLPSTSDSNATIPQPDPYITNLRADIVKLREQYQAQTDDSSQNSVLLISSDSSAQASTQLISTANKSNSNYNQTIKIDLGVSVAPQLPPLSSPDQYLPNSPTQFDGYIWPAKGVLTSGYGWRWGRMHKGIDIAAPIGTPIMAAADGEVVSAGWNSGGYGNLVKVQHSDGSVTLYAHNNKILVHRGQTVEQGQLIAEMGSTGFSTGPHLHFEIRPNGDSAVNPIAYLPDR